MGRLNDRLGPRVVLAGCGLLIGVGYVLMSQVSAAWQLYLYYGVIIGIGMSGTAVPLMSTVARWFVARRGIMTGIIMNGMGIGGLIAPLATYWLIRTYDWRLSFAILGGVVFIVIVFMAQFLRRDPAKMGLAPYGENATAEQRMNSGTNGFSLRQTLPTGRFWIIVVMFFCLAFSLQIVLVHIVPYVTDLGVSPATAASILAAVGGTSIVGRVAAGLAADRIGNIRVFIICFAVMLAALLWISSTTAIWAVYASAIILAFVSPGAVALTSPLIAELFGLRAHGFILGVAMCGFTIGAAAGPLVAGYAFDITGSYIPAFMVCAALSVAGLVLAILLRPAITAGQEKRYLR
jgi:MFS family permease